MLGNDLVDLRKAAKDSNWRRPGYLEKIYSPAEIHMISSSANPNSLVWLLWSMKEAAYKIVNRHTGLRFYAPQQFTCSLIDWQKGLALGSVIFKGETFATQTTVTQELVHTVAVAQDGDFDKVKVCHLPNQHDYLSRFNAKQVQHRLTKDHLGLPITINLQNQLIQPASVSHHGSYLSVVYFQS